MTITQKFRSVGWVAAVTSAALACYLISYRVSAERSALENVEADIAQARGDILALNTEFETRSRMSQLERWNRRDFVLTAPTAEQVLEGEVELASLFDGGGDRRAPVRLASADADRRPGGRDLERPDPDGLDVPRIQHASYLVPAEADRRTQGERVAFLDESLRGEIAQRASIEYRGEDSRN